MDRIYNLIVIFMLVFIATLSIPYGIKVGKKLNHEKAISSIEGKVIGFDGKLLAVEFDKPIVRGCGDTQIHSFLVSRDGKSIQLKPIFLPQLKALELTESKVLVFPVSDILPLLEPQLYGLQIFIKSDCSIVNSKSIQLPLIPVPLGSDKPTIKEEIV